jgi:seryl-tRNA synthetase
MLDIKFIRENPELIREAARKKHINFNVDELISSDQKRVEKLSVVESLRAEQNLVSDKIPSASPEERQTLIAQMSLLKEDLKKQMRQKLLLKIMQIMVPMTQIQITQINYQHLKL